MSVNILDYLWKVFTCAEDFIESELDPGSEGYERYMALKESVQAYRDTYGDKDPNEVATDFLTEEEHQYIYEILNRPARRLQ